MLLETILDGQDLLGEISAAVTGISRSGSRRIAGRGALQPSGDSCFRIASLTKTFTSAAVVLALRAHHVALNTPAIDLLPSLGADWHADRTVTVEQLLGQVSGLRESVDATTMATLGDGPEAILEGARLAVWAGNERPPGTRWSYYNGNYFLAGAILASVCGTTYEAALAQCVLTPWGLTRTSFDPPATPIPGSDGTTPPPIADYPRSRRPSGGLWSCVDDLLALGEHLLAETDLCGETRRPRTAPLDPMTYGSAGRLDRPARCTSTGACLDTEPPCSCSRTTTTSASCSPTSRPPCQSPPGSSAISKGHSPATTYRQRSTHSPTDTSTRSRPADPRR